MLQGTTLNDMAAEITRVAKAKHDIVADTRQMQYTTDGTLLVDAADGNGGLGDYPLRALAADQIGDRVGIPRRYWRRMQDEAPALLATNVNHWFQQKPERRLVRTLDGKVRAFLSDRYLRLDHYDVAQNLLPVLQQAGCEVASCSLTETRMYIKATLPGMQATVQRRNTNYYRTGDAPYGDAQVGDTVFGGIYIGNSEVGLGSLEVYPLTEVLACRNGMVHKQYGATRRHVGKRIADDDTLVPLMSQEALEADDKAFWLAIRDLVQASLTEARFKEIVAGMQAAADSEPMRKPVEAVKVLANQLVLDDGEADGVLGHLVQGGDLSAWGAANALTRYAQDVASYDRSTELEVAGDKVVAMAATAEWRKVALAGA